MNRRDRATVIGALTLAAAGIVAGVVSGAYQVPPSVATASASETVTALDCSRFDDGAPAGHYIGGACYMTTTTTTPEGEFPNLDTSAYGTDIPRCWTDDSNTHHVGRCYTEAPGRIILLDAHDHTVAVLR